MVRSSRPYDCLPPAVLFESESMSEGNIYPNIWHEGGEALDCFRVNREESVRHAMRQRPNPRVAGDASGRQKYTIFSTPDPDECRCAISARIR